MILYGQGGVNKKRVREYIRIFIKPFFTELYTQVSFVYKNANIITIFLQISYKSNKYTPFDLNIALL